MKTTEIDWQIPEEFDGGLIFEKISEHLMKESSVEMLKRDRGGWAKDRIEYRLNLMDSMSDALECNGRMAMGARTEFGVEKKLSKDKPNFSREEIATIGLDILDYFELQQDLRKWSNLSGFEFKTGSRFAVTQKDHHEMMEFVVRLGKTFSSGLEVMDSASQRLYEVRREMEKCEYSIKRELEQLLKDVSVTSYLQEEFYVELNGRYVLLVKTDFKGRMKGVAHGVSQSGNTTYFEPMSLLEKNNSFELLREQEAREIQRILSELVQTIIVFKNPVRAILRYLRVLDVLQAKTLFCKSIEAKRPTISADGSWRISGYFHPLIDNCVTNDIQLKDKQRILVLSGPNSGGKTVTLKSVGLCMYFASLGMYVPAWEAVLPEIGNLLFLMGDYQSLSDSLSSFAAHLKRWKGVLGKASSKTFLLVDEIMDATDPREGECLAVEMLKHLGALGLQGIVSTHYSEVKKLPLDDMAFVNGSMVFDTKNLEPTYMLAMGTPGNSYGIELAQKFKLPKGIVAGARKAMGKRHFELNRLIAQQKEEQVKIRKLKEKHQVMLAKFKELRTVGRQLLTDFEKKTGKYFG
jgi:DNA mismatch repair protein MutS2